ncbi:MAG: hypothetical protein HOL51_27160 [Gemmatimonadetes bacterium]|nr:hypothetical protein [Gemmatimonadota bacterium]MDE0964994.1 hypothetical protein [Candidatus Latescibacterota bacterium]MBT5329798.1 hypothetical protein [Gemmatimonadota bacterium]MBT5452350.1 hypothetical protein [Gemmatimonadota bacterium]MBT5803958.1 hypothetical protein [Gemmatimonadota bacterium]
MCNQVGLGREIGHAFSGGADEEFILDDRAIRVLHQRRRGQLRIECDGDDKARMVVAEAIDGPIPNKI